MKYTMTVACILLAIMAHAQAQMSTTKWQFGIKGDLNYTSIQGNGMASGFVLGGQGGIFAEKPLSAKWSVQPELLYTQSNAKKGSDFMVYYNTNGNPFASENIKLGYISVPVLVKYKFNEYFSILAGPQASFLVVDAESLMEAGDDMAFKNYEISGNVGAQFTLGHVSLYGRYNQGFTNINNIDDRYKWHSKHIQVGIAIRFK